MLFLIQLDFHQRDKRNAPSLSVITKSSNRNYPPEDDDEEGFKDQEEIENSEESSEQDGSETSISDKLTWVAKIAYASVGLPYSMQLSIMAFYINYFLLDVAKV